MGERITLMDLALRGGIVEHEGREIQVHALANKHLLELLDRWEQVQKFLAGLLLSPAEAAKAAPDVLVAILARGLRHSLGAIGTMAEAEAVASELPAQLQIKLLTKIWGLTFTEGFSPFVATAKAVVNVFVEVGRVQGPPLRRPSRPTRPDTGPASGATPGKPPPDSSPPPPSSRESESSQKSETIST